jgi:hypothetical protein
MPSRPIVATGLLLAALFSQSLPGCGRATGVGDGRDEAVGFLDLLRTGLIEPAWQRTSTEFRSLMGQENLRDYVRSRPGLSNPTEHTGSAEVERGGRSMVEHTFRPVPAGPASAATIKVLLANGAGGWEVEHLTVE